MNGRWSVGTGTGSGRRPDVRRALTGGRLLWPDGRLRRGELVLHGERIEAVLPAGAALDGAEALDVTGCVVAPGFVDTHVHGGQGANFMSADPALLGRISAYLAAGGVTSCLAGTASLDVTRTADAVAALAALTGRLAGTGGDTPGITMLGIHLEGPFLNPSFRGVHRSEHLRAPTAAELDRLLDLADGALRVVTLAPELPGGPEAVRRLDDAGVVVALGHSGAGDAEASDAVQAGVRRATHLFNGLPPIHHRDPGPVPVLLTDERVRCEVVADGLHVAPRMLRFAVDVAGPDRIMLVSDGTDVAGLPDGRHRRYEGTEVVVHDGQARTPSGGLAGSVTRLADMVRLMVDTAGVDLADALRMAAQTPARSLGLTDRGTLAAGACADVVVLGDDLRVQRTLAHGSVIYSSSQEDAS
ncbi:N-acetylglucosamine-6-phosphate deacetylase [Streptomyces sp. TS71-3]|uniref:N-acetylglucosamine-6-phosphate deacetylase n=1 Tax=Streptomyces sp. TS71-3 TaxID=2733862 RepID=UPI001AFDFAAC|nr:N-acetylglucosamine-6-phosphate deacetylase [Streptomyces sp. TS71-3]GHJ41913.1 N-acetylglucosamine-6-phosphate deacetylase [Streptomyces sp. TS71-3]